MSLLPPNASPLERALEEAMQVPALPVPLREIWSAEDCPEPLLPWLAWAFSVDEWDAGWPLAVRRAVVARSIDVHFRKGTLSAVRNAVAAFGGAIAVREWWETDPAGTPGTFTLQLTLSELSGATPDAAYIADVIRQVTRAKPLSRHFTFAIAQSATGAIAVTTAARPAIYARLQMAA